MSDFISKDSLEAQTQPQTFKVKCSKTSAGKWTKEFSVYGCRSKKEAEALGGQAIEAINSLIKQADALEN